ncbi:hypothetical protein J6590_062082 [Homalodisca vitripennis]|nr:hypothetical protein J6590_062082 [Homalodisca vitripennis]
MKKTKQRGGTLIFIKEHINSVIYDRLPSVVEELQFEAAAVLLCDFKTVVVSFYRPPQGNTYAFLDKLHHVFSSLYGGNFNLILAGDFNIDFMSLTSETLQLQNLINSFNLTPAVVEITRPNATSDGGDDLGMCIQDKCVDNTNAILTDSSETILDWCSANKLNLNSKKTQDLTLSISNKGGCDPPLKYLQ